MTAITTTWVAKDNLTAAAVNALGLAFSALGITDDNTGDLILPRSPFLLTPVRAGAANLEGIARSGAAYTVPASKVLEIVAYTHAAGVSTTVTPSGGAAINLEAGGGARLSKPRLTLKAGDAISLGAAAMFVGHLTDADAAITNVLQVVNNVTTYTVAANKLLVLLYAAPNANNSATLTIDGNNAATVSSPGAGDTLNCPIILKAGQTVGGSAATNILINGYVVSY